MAANPFATFHKNKRFWMAAILMVCMVSFVFCTGLRGDMAEKITNWARGTSGPAIVSIDGRGVSDRDLSDLKMQRNLANSFMRNCAEAAHKNLAKFFFDEGKKQDTGKEKDAEARREVMIMRAKMRDVINQRRAKPRYFDIGTKFDDLIEFKLWQAEADRLGIRLEPEHITMLFKMEFYGDNILSPEDINRAQLTARRDIHRDASDQQIHRALGEEFRVRIAQLVLLQAQPYSTLPMFGRKGERGTYTFKFGDPAVPDETRAPLTMAQLYDIYKSKRSEFEVTLLPVKIEDFVATLKEEPTDAQKREFFDAHKGKSFDPSVDAWAMEIPVSSRIEYVYADAKSPFYLGKAKLVSALKGTDSFAFDAAMSPLAAAVHSVAIAHKHKADLQAQYDTLVSKVNVSKQDRYRGAALYSDPDCATPVLAFMASQHDDLVMKLIGASAMAPIDGLSSFLAQGAARHPAEVDEALRSEADRRAPRYAALFGIFAGSQNMIDMAAPVLALDAMVTFRNNNIAPEMERVFAANPGLQVLLQRWEYVHPLYTIETVQQPIQAMIDERMAEEWAQANMLTLKDELKNNNDDPAKYRRVFNQQHIKDMQLTYGPPADKKSKFYNRFEIGDAEEFKVLKDSYLKYLDMINLFEGRDLSPNGVLKASDYPKMFFDPTESFSVASSLYRAMPWPPEVTAKQRTTEIANPRLFNQENVVMEDMQRFRNHLDSNDPNKEPPKLDLFKTAARPILFWRTGEILANRPNNYDKIARDIEDFKAERTKIEAELAKNPKGTLLQTKKGELDQSEADLRTLQNRIVQGWKAEQARKLAVPEAKKAAEKVLDHPGKYAEGLEKAAASLKSELHLKSNELIVLPKLSQLQPEKFAGRGTDYGPPQLKDSRIQYPREDMMKQLLSLYDLSSEIKTVVPDMDPASKALAEQLDSVNKELFDKLGKGAALGTRVQILANKPRTVYFVAAVTQLPKFNELQFAEAMRGADFPRDFDPRFLAMRDHFAERAQEEQAQVFRRDFITSLRHDHKVENINEEAKKRFDEHGGND